MNGADLGQIAQNFLTYFGGANGGYICAAIALVVWMLCAGHVMSPRSGVITFVSVIVAWAADYLVTNTIGWGA